MHKPPQDFPRPEKQPFKLEKHGDVRMDDYYWLRERENPKVIDHLKAENAYTERALAPVSSLRESLFDEMKSRVKEDDESAHTRFRGFEYYHRMIAGLQYPVFLRKSIEPGAKEEILIDVNALAKGKDFTQCSGPIVSPNQKIMAYGCDFVGRRFYDLRVKDLSTGKDLGVDLKNVNANVAWAADNRHFFYTRQDPKTLRSHQVWRYDLQSKSNQLVYEEKDETFSVWVSDTSAENFVLMGISSTLTSEMRYVDAKNPTAPFKVFLPREREHEYQVYDGGDRFYVRTNWKAKDFRLMETPFGQTDKKHWKEIVPHRPGTTLNDVEIFKDWIAMGEKTLGLDHIFVRERKTGKTREIPFQDQNYLVEMTGNAEYDSRTLRYSYESMRQPETIFDYDFASGASTTVKVREVPNYDASKYRTERIWITARDGKKIPVSLLMKKEIKTDAANPMLVYGYGSYGFSMSPWFSSTVFSLVDRGWVYAMTHIRGGMELGREHYDNGRTMNKLNTFTDFIDTTEALVKQGYADPKRVYAEGGSAGGLLMGAVINMRPDLYRGVVAAVPFVDVVTTMLDDSIPLTTGEYDEWGNPNEAKAYAYIKQYSPYDNVKAQPYPNMLITTGLHDSQVQYWEPAKWAAKIRDLKTNDSLILLKTEMNAGHGGASGRYEALKEKAVEWAFLLMIDGNR